MRYIAIASPDFAARMLPHGLGEANFARVPFLVFNRKDDAQQQWVRQVMGLRSARLNARYVPSSEGYVNAVRMGWGVGVAPELQVRPLLASGELVALRPEVQVAVALYWHQWKLGGETAVGGEPRRAAPEGGTPPALLDQIGEALARGAREALMPA